MRWLIAGGLALAGAWASAAEPAGGGLDVARVKAATVLVRTDSAAGSAFVVLRRGALLYLVTNHHVVAEAASGGTVRVTYDPGSPSEWTGTATVVASNAIEDLALLASGGPARPPEPLSGSAEVSELLEVVAAGFPFGERLSAGDKAPAPTLTRASISAVRTGDLGGVEVLQLGGSLNPGNSGGPVVNLKGQVVGVATATVTGAGIGFLVPWAKVAELLQGRSAEVEVQLPEDCTRRCAAGVQVSVVDPFRTTSKVELRVVEADGMFLTEPHPAPYRAEGRPAGSAARPASGALALSAKVPVDARKRYFLQVGYLAEGRWSYGLPFDLARAIERPAAARRPAAPPPTPGKGQQPPEPSGPAEMVWTGHEGFCSEWSFRWNLSRTGPGAYAGGVTQSHRGGPCAARTGQVLGGSVEAQVEGDEVLARVRHDDGNVCVYRGTRTGSQIVGTQTCGNVAGALWTALIAR